MINTWGRDLVASAILFVNQTFDQFSQVLEIDFNTNKLYNIKVQIKKYL